MGTNPYYLTRPIRKTTVTMQYTLLALTALASLASTQQTPTGIDLTIYSASDACEFTDTTIDTFAGCQNFPTEVRSFTNNPVNVEQITLYAGRDCTGAGTTIHMDYDGCQNASIPGIEGLGE
ncbi:MAG: hypothetical protein Q9162_003600 [Coniocarpon cinnabarinum]